MLVFCCCTRAPAVQAKPPPLDPPAAAARLLQDTMRREHLPSISAAVVIDGRPVFVRASGLAQVRHNKAATVTTRYITASITKAFTAVAALTLRRGGRLDFDAPIARYLPLAPSAAHLSVRQLLTHTSGLPDFMNATVLGADPASLTPEAILRRIGRLPLAFRPGTRYGYSNTNYLLLGAVIEAVTSRPYAETIEETIVHPLRLRHTGYAGMGVPIDTTGYAWHRSRQQPVPYPKGFGFLSSAGALSSTPLDIALFDEALMRHRVVTAAEFAEMSLPPHLPARAKTEYAYGFKVKNASGDTMLFHTGRIPGYSGINVLYPSQRMAVVVFTNTSTFDPTNLAHRLSVLFRPPHRTAQ